MKSCHFSPIYLSVLVVTGAIILSTGAPVHAQVKSSPAKSAARAWTPPRTPDGQPDLQGLWSYGTLTPLERPRDVGAKRFFTKEEALERERRILQLTDADRRDSSPPKDVGAYNQIFFERGSHFAVVDGQIPTSLIADPPDGRIPALTPDAVRREAARRESLSKRGPADSWTDRDLSERCLTRSAPKVPGAYNNNLQIVQTRDSVAILQEMLHEVRVIRLDGSPHLTPKVRLWMGDSIGHWEGDTLVVDTTNYNDDVRFALLPCCGRAGESLHVVERFRRVDENTIDYRYTVDDPATFSRPWTVVFPLKNTGEQLYEYACHEGNYGMLGILKGARMEEANRKK